MRFISKKLEWSGFNSLLANLHERKYDDFRNLFFICKLAPTDAHDAYHDERKTLSFTMVYLNIPKYVYFLSYSSLNQPLSSLRSGLNLDKTYDILLILYFHNNRKWFRCDQKAVLIPNFISPLDKDLCRHWYVASRN